MLIYVAAPYTDPDPKVVEARIDAFSRLMVWLIEHGNHPVSPLMNHFLTERKLCCRFPLTWEYWKDYSEALLSKCDKLMVLTIEGWENSPGVQAEIDIATRLNIDIKYVGPIRDTSDT